MQTQKGLNKYINNQKIAIKEIKIEEDVWIETKPQSQPNLGFKIQTQVIHDRTSITETICLILQTCPKPSFFCDLKNSKKRGKREKIQSKYNDSDGREKYSFPYSHDLRTLIIMYIW